MHDMESRVFEFVVRTLGVRRDELNLDTTLLGDLGVAGDDADEFFAAFAHEFRVDLSAIDLSGHFGGEGLLPWQVPIVLARAIAEWIFPRRHGRTPEDRAQVIPITMRHLVTAAETGHWR